MGARVAVLGAGSWGTAFSLVLADAGNDVIMWARRPELAEDIRERHRNPDYFADLELPAPVTATPDPAEAMADAELVVLAVPSQSLRENLALWTIPDDALVLSLAKGIEVNSGLRMSQVITEVAGIDPARVGVLSGPNLSAEIAGRQPAASVIAAPDPAIAQRLQRICHSPTFRPYVNHDVIGTEIAGATKNVIALAVGMSDGLGYGANSQASLITRGLAETTRLGVVLGAEEYTFAGLAGVGDLVATCSSPLSRNRSFGTQLGKGRSVVEIAAGTRQVAEGVTSCRSIAQVSHDLDVELPIVDAVAAVVGGEITAEEGLTRLLSRALGHERG